MSEPWGNVAGALQAKLVADATLLSLTGHTSTSPAIGTSYPSGVAPKKFLAIQLFNSRPLTQNATQIKVMRIDLLAFCVKKSQSIAITDRVEYLFDNPTGDNAGYFDFSNSNIKVQDSRNALRLPEFFYKDLDRYVEGIRVKVIVDPYNSCL